MHSNVTILVGGGPVSPADLDFVRRTKSRRLMAVDGGANHLPKDLSPDVIIGDLDSLDRTKVWDQTPTMLHITNQDTTDLEKAILHCIRIGADQPLICFGFVGGRFDQTLTIQHTHLLFPETRLVFVSNSDVITCLEPGSVILDLPIGARLSLYPLTPCTFANSSGLKYPLNGLKLEQGRQIGTSNQVVEPRVQFEMITGSCLLILERAHLCQLMTPNFNIPLHV